MNEYWSKQGIAKDLSLVNLRFTIKDARKEYKRLRRDKTEKRFVVMRNYYKSFIFRLSRRILELMEMGG